jgi:hypothetical protein
VLGGYEEGGYEEKVTLPARVVHNPFTPVGLFCMADIVWFNYGDEGAPAGR